jgi:hypothetical protein
VVPKGTGSSAPMPPRRSLSMTKCASRASIQIPGPGSSQLAARQKQSGSHGLFPPWLAFRCCRASCAHAGRSSPETVGRPARFRCQHERVGGHQIADALPRAHGEGGGERVGVGGGRGDHRDGAPELRAPTGARVEEVVCPEPGSAARPVRWLRRRSRRSRSPRPPQAYRIHTRLACSFSTWRARYAPCLSDWNSVHPRRMTTGPGLP